MDFKEAERRYVDLKRQFDAGTIGIDEFDVARQRLMVQDDEGRWWCRSPSNDEWTCYDGSAWVPSTPPSYQEATPEPTDVKNGRQRVPPWILVAGIALVVGVAFGWALASRVPGGPAPDEQGRLEKRLDRVQATLDEQGKGLDAVFIHHATRENITEHWTYIDHPLVNDNPDAILYVMPNYNPHGEKHAPHEPHPIGVWYDQKRGRWTIYNEDRAPMVAGEHFNVAVLKKPTEPAR